MDEWEPPVLGKAVYFRGNFERPLFFDNREKLMMDKYRAKWVHYKTEDGEILQFRLARFRCRDMMLLTSTMEDTFWFRTGHPSIEDTMRYAEQGMVKRPSKTSISGYVCWGGYFKKQEKRLRENMEKHNFSLPPDALKSILNELLRRRKIYG